MTYHGVRYIGYLALFSVMLFSLTKQYGFYFNVSESLPHKLYISKKSKDFKRGDYVVFKTAFKADPVTKKVTGIPGDRITSKNREVIVYDISVGTAQNKRSNGDRLQVIKDQIIPEGYYFVSGTHEKSFDSRYQEFGLVSKDMILGKAIPLC